MLWIRPRSLGWLITATRTSCFFFAAAWVTDKRASPAFDLVGSWIERYTVVNGRTSLAGSPLASAAPAATAPTTTASRSARPSFTRESLPDRVPDEQDDDHDRRRSAAEGGDGREQPDQRATAAHPPALSTRSTVNGRWPGGATWNERPQCPTITSAGAAWPYVPGPVSERW